MRNWFILFTTTFTVTTLTIVLATWLYPNFIVSFNSDYIVMLAISSAILSSVILLLERLSLQNKFLIIATDLISIFTIVFTTGLAMRFYRFEWPLFLFILLLVILIYIIISLIYLSILKKEADEMNRKLTTWRNKNVKRNKSE